MEEKNFQKFCRTCIKEQEQADMVNITSIVNCNGTNVQIINILNIFVRTQISENDGFSNLICSNCVDCAIKFYNFKLQCDQCRLHFEQFVEVKEEFDSLTNTVTEQDVSNGEEIKEEPEGEQKEHVQVCDTSYSNKSVIKTSDLKMSRKIKKERQLSTLNNIVNPTDMGSLYVCSQCNKSFKNKYIFNAHEKRHEFKGQFLCNVCGKGFSSQSCLTRHNRVHTGEKNYECKECHKRFPSSNNLNLHSRIHSGHKPYLCTVCGNRFSHPTGLTYHMRTHTNEKPYCCGLCDKRFTTQCNFDRHKKTHSGERPFACKKCEKAFIKKIDLQRHEAIHTGLKPHSCSICKKSFLRMKNLKFHMMLHTEERPHICRDCGKGFIRSYYLKDHIKKHHVT